MQKKALILAVSAALVIPAAMAQKKGEKSDADSVVELYGKVYPELVFPSSSGATDAGRTLCTICGTAAGENAIIKKTEMESFLPGFKLNGNCIRRPSSVPC